MKSTTMYFEGHPLFGFFLSGVLTILGFGLGGDLHLQVHLVQDTGFPEWLKDLFQCLAWSGAGATGFVAFHGFWMKNVAPTIQKRKEKRKK